MQVRRDVQKQTVAPGPQIIGPLHLPEPRYFKEIPQIHLSHHISEIHEAEDHFQDIPAAVSGCHATKGQMLMGSP